MSLIVLMEDDDGTRMLLTSLLKKQGYNVIAAVNGAVGLEQVLAHRPDLIISDVQMPEMNGLQMLASLRRHPELGATPVILLTSMQERAVMRAGMNTGADDYITKPFKPAEVFDAVNAQLRKRDRNAAAQELSQAAAVEEALKIALAAQREEMLDLYEVRLAHELSDRWPGSDNHADDHTLPEASVLYVDVNHFGRISQLLTSEELSGVIKKFYAALGDSMNLFGAHAMQFVGAGLLAVFVDQPPADPDPDNAHCSHAVRAMRAAMSLQDSARGMRHILQNQFPGRDLPELTVCVALHCGTVTLAVLSDGLHGTLAHKLPVGADVNATIQIQKQAVPLGWQIAASAAVLRLTGDRAKTGRQAALAPAGGMPPLNVSEVLGWVAS